MKLDKEQLRLLENASYAKKQLFSPNRIISWSHKIRHQFAIKLIKKYWAPKILDYGCGDGSFLVYAKNFIPDKVGADIDSVHVNDCRKRFACFDDFKFYFINELLKIGQTFDLITCFEVMEHCTDESLNELLNNIKGLLGKNGTFLVSVPIEIGPSLILKEIIREIVARRKIGHYQYRGRYLFKEFFQMILATGKTYVKRNYYKVEKEGEDKDYITSGHKGFNWRSLRLILVEHFDLVEMYFTPLRFFGPHLNSQAWFVLKHKD